MKRFALACVSLVLASTMMLAQSNPIPLINQALAPASAAPGGSGFTLTLNGTGFTPSRDPARFKGNSVAVNSTPANSVNNG